MILQDLTNRFFFFFINIFVYIVERLKRQEDGPCSGLAVLSFFSGEGKKKKRQKQDESALYVLY